MHVIVLSLCLFWPASTVIATSHACESLVDIAANGDSNITSIDCHYQNGTQTIPAQLGTNSNLTSIKISCESRGCIDGTIPTELGQLQNLQSFELVGSAVNGTIPSEFGNLKLAHFSVSNAHLSGTIPESLMWNIRTLNVSYNYLTGRLSGFPNISHVELQYNLFTGGIPDRLKYYNKGILLPNRFVEYDRRPPENRERYMYDPKSVLACTSNSRDEPCNEEELYYFSLPSVRTGERCGEEPIENSYFEELVPTGCFLSKEEYIRYDSYNHLSTEKVFLGNTKRCRVHCCKGGVSKFCTRCDTNGECVEISDTLTMFFNGDYDILSLLLPGMLVAFEVACGISILLYVCLFPAILNNNQTQSREQAQHRLGDGEESGQNSQFPIVESAPKEKNETEEEPLEQNLQATIGESNPEESDDTQMDVQNNNAESNAPIVKQHWSDQNRYVLFLAMLSDCWLLWFLLTSVPLCILYIQSFQAAILSCAFDTKQPVFDFPSWSTCDQLLVLHLFFGAYETSTTYVKVLTWLVRICFVPAVLNMVITWPLATFRVRYSIFGSEKRYDKFSEAVQKYPQYLKHQGSLRSTHFATIMRCINHNPASSFLLLWFDITHFKMLYFNTELNPRAANVELNEFARFMFLGILILGAIALHVIFPYQALFMYSIILPISGAWQPYWYGITMIQDVTRFDYPKLLQVAIDADMPRHVNEDVWYVLSRKYSGEEKKHTLEIVKMLIDDQKGYDKDWKPSSSLLLDCRQRNKSIMELAECWDDDRLVELVRNGNHSEQFVDEVEQEDSLSLPVV